MKIHEEMIYAVIIIAVGVGGAVGFSTMHSDHISGLPPHPNVVLAASEQNYWVQEDYVSCISIIEEYVENKPNNRWVMANNHAIQDWAVEYCGKDPQMSNHTQS